MFDPKPDSRGRSPLVGGLLLSFLAFAAWRTAECSHPTGQESSAPRAVAARAPLLDEEQATIELFQRASASVVHVTNIDLRRRRFTMDVMAVPQGTGSGLVWNEEGYIVTNYHVVHGARAAFVTLADSSRFQAQVVGLAPEYDLAVLKIDAPNRRLSPLPLGTSYDLRVGQRVYAIGNPFGLDQTLTTGVVSGLGRSIRSLTGHSIENVVQSDAAINPGNSGGPLLDSAGRLIGINTAIYSPSGVSAGISFSVPVDTVNSIVPQLIEGRSARLEQAPRAGLGISIASDAFARLQGVEGVVVVDVQPGSSAAGAGLRGIDEGEGEFRMDVIVEIDRQRIRGQADLLAALRTRKAGDEVELVYQRAGQRHQRRVALQAIQ